MRGQTPLLGLHSARVDRSGITVFPRFESLAGPGELPIRDEHVWSGLPELDAMLAGGRRSGSTTVLAGAVGTGKTLLGLQFLLEGARTGQPGLLVSLLETEAEFIAKASRFGLELESAIRDGDIVVSHRIPVDLSVDSLMYELSGANERVRPRRFVLEGVEELLEPIAEESRRRSLMHVLAGLIRARGTTAIIPVVVAKAIGPELGLELTPIAALAHNLMLMRHVEDRGELYRILSILKMRDSDFDASIRRYTITSAGLRILTQSKTATGLLAGIDGRSSEAGVERPGGLGGSS